MAPGPHSSPWGFWAVDDRFPLGSGPPVVPQEESALSWDEAVEFGGLEVILALVVVVVVVVVVFIIIVLFGPLESVFRLASCRPPFPMLLLPNTVPLFTSLASSVILLLSGAAVPPQPSRGPCWEAIPSFELIP